MASVPSFPEGQVESLAKLLGECGSGADISRGLGDRGLLDTLALRRSQLAERMNAFIKDKAGL